MQVTELGLPGVKLIVPDYFDDNRGYSAETYNHKVLEGYGIFNQFVVDYECYNAACGTIRGIHFQNNPKPQAKLVRVLQGEVLDFIVDLRRDSPTFKIGMTRRLVWNGIRKRPSCRQTMHRPRFYRGVM